MLLIANVFMSSCRMTLRGTEEAVEVRTNVLEIVTFKNTSILIVLQI